MAESAGLRQRQHPTDKAAVGSVAHLASLVIGSAAVGGVLWWLNGPPEVPRSLPDWDRTTSILTGSYLPYEDVIYIATSLAWLALGYLALTVGLRLVVHALARLSDGAAWARTALSLSDAVTLPIVRRIVDTAVAGSLFLSVWLRPAPAMGTEASLQSSAVAMVGLPQADPTPQLAGPSVCDPAGGEVSSTETDACFLSYTVVEGDNLWDISRRFYGDGTLYVLIFRVNEGRVMTTGEPFTDPRLIRPGWVLDVPLPGYNVWTADGQVMYRVRPDDSLWRISERFLGNGFRWTEIWGLNQGRVMADGRRFGDPDSIYPGWILEVPPEAAAPVAVPSAVPAEAAATVPSPTTAHSVTPEATNVPLPEPTAVPAQQPARDGGGDVQWPVRPPILAAAAGLAAAGAIALIVRKVVRRDGTFPVRVGARDGRGRRSSGDVGRVVLAARALMHCLAELEFDDLRLVLVREAERFLEFSLDCAPGDAEAAVRSRYNLGRRLACAVDGEVLNSTRIRLKLSRFQRLAGLLMDGGAAGSALLLVPVGAAESGVHYLNLAAVGNVAVVGGRYEVQRLLSAWLATLAAIHGPEELSFLSAGDATTEIGEAAGLPHFAAAKGGLERSVEELAAELQEAMVARDASGTAVQRAAIVALVRLVEDSEVGVEHLDTVLRRGPEHGIYTLALEEGIHDPEALGAFGASVVFGGLGQSEGSAESGAPGASPDEIVLTVGREPALVLRPIEVRAEVLRPIAGPNDSAEREKSGFAEPGGERQAEETQDDLPPVPENTDPDEVEQAAAGSVMEPAETVEEARSQPACGDGRSEAAGPHASRQALLLVAEEGAQEEKTGTATGPVLTVRCFGCFHAEADGREVSGWKIQKARELLAYLIARGGTGVLRDEVAEALWPDGISGQVEHLLSNAAYYLRRALKSAVPRLDMQVLTTSSQRYHLRPGMFRVDVDAFDAQLQRAETLEGADALVQYERALELYRGDFLGKEPFEWAETYRRDYERRFLGAAHRAAKLALDCRQERKAVEFYQAILTHDPIDEEAARGLMRSYRKLGDVNGVRKVYKVLTESLRRELEDEKAEPLPETTALMQQLTRSRRG